MTYANNVTRDAAANEYFVKLSPRIVFLQAELTVVSGDPLAFGTDPVVYSIAFPYGVPTSIQQQFFGSVFGTLTLGTSSNLTTPRTFYFDTTTQTLFICTQGIDIQFKFLVYFDMYLSSRDCVWYSDPTDETSAPVKWTGSIKTAPIYSMTAELQSYGFVPLSSTQLQVINDRNIFQKIIHKASFNSSEVVCWHQCGNLDTDDIQRIITGSISGRVQYSNDIISFEITDKQYIFDEKVSYGSSDGKSLEYFSASTFGSTNPLDPSFDGKPIRMVYGRVNGFIGVNADFNSDAPTTSNNRRWVIGHGQGADHWDSFSCTIIAAVSTNGFTVSNADGKNFGVFDRIWIDKATDQWATIVSITASGGNTKIVCSNITGTTFSGTLAGFTVSKSYVRNIFFVDKANSKYYQMEYGRDYTESNFAQTTSGITLKATAESNVSAPTFNPTNHTLVFNVAGKRTQPTIGGVEFDTQKGLATLAYAPELKNYGAFQEVAVILYDFLKTEFGLSESLIDAAGLLSFNSTVNPSQVGFAIPQTADGEFPTYKQVINALLQSVAGKCLFDSNGIFKIKWVDVISSASVELLKEDMIGDLSVEYDYTQMSAFTQENFAEVLLSPTYRAAIGLDDPTTHFTLDQNKTYPATPVFRQPQANLQKLTAITYEDVSILNSLDIIGQVLWYNGYISPPSIHTTLQYLSADRTCRFRFTVKNQLISLNIGDAVKITRDDLPGFDPGTTNSRYYVITDIEKGNGQIVVTVDDQRFIQEEV